MRVGGTTSIGIRDYRRPTSRSTHANVGLDIDVSLRHAEVSLRVEDCAGLYQLSKVYLPRHEEVTDPTLQSSLDPEEEHFKPLFREDFWYFNGLHVDGDSQSGELNFDTLSNLLEQVRPHCGSILCLSVVDFCFKSILSFGAGP